MKLIEWNTETSRPEPKRDYRVTIAAYHGAIVFSHDLTEHLRLFGQRVIFHQDQDKPKNWYLEVVPDNNTKGFPLFMRATPKRKHRSAFFRNHTLSKKIAESISTDGSFQIPVSIIADEGYYPLLTAGVKKMKPKGKHSKKS
jgi:hypothetical protein